MRAPDVDSDAVRQQYHYELLTWPEINEAVRQEKVVILPIGSVEQHGWHLPLDVDFRLASSVCLGAGRLAPENILVMPPVNYGYCHHVMDFPGTINIEPTTFVRFVMDITRSVAYHGFKHIILINGHGSNHHLVEQAARQTNLQTNATCCMLSWWQLIAEKWNTEIRTSVMPGGCAHACELETSMYMHLKPDGVRMDRIKGALPSYMTDVEDGAKWQWVDLTMGGGVAEIVGWTSQYAETGAFGEPEKATEEKGRRVFAHATEQLVELVRWFKARPPMPRQDHHATEPSFALPFDF